MKINVKNNIDTKKVKSKVQQADFKSVEHAVAILRKQILQIIRRGVIGKNAASVKLGSPGRNANGAFQYRKCLNCSRMFVEVLK